MLHRGGHEGRWHVLMIDRFRLYRLLRAWPDRVTNNIGQRHPHRLSGGEGFP